MDIQELLQFIYLLIFTVGAVFVGFLCVDFKVCHDCTKTWWGLHFMLNSKYWAMSILYWRYHEKKAEGMTTEDFVNYFTQKYLVDISRSKWNLMPGKKRLTFIKILSNTRFIDEYLNVDKYSYTYHKEVMAAWEDLKKRNEQELARNKDLFNF